MVIINVTSVNDAPVIVDDAATTNEDTPIAINILGNDTDVDGAIIPANVNVLLLPKHGTISKDNAGVITYTPNPNFNGVDTLMYQYCDGGTPSLCDTAIVVITVTPVNDAPVATFNGGSTDEDTPITIAVLGNDTDVDSPLNNPHSSTLAGSNPSNGTVVYNADGTITYTPNANYSGPDSFIYEICDNGTPQKCDTAIVYINVTPVPDAKNDTATVKGGTSVAIPWLKNDEGVTETPSIITTPTHGTVTVNADGTITYIPKAGFVGVDSLVYVVCNNVGKCDTAIVYINVTRPEALDVPEGFSPNGDGVNDTFVIPGIETYPTTVIKFFNRWGNLVYEESNYQNNWNGTSNKGLTFGGDVLPVGTYFYILDLGVAGKDVIKGYVYIGQ
jgi:gliding motility-associated-like protein